MMKQELVEKDYDNLGEVDFWEKLKTFNFQIPKIEDLGQSYLTFIEGLKYWISMESDKAEQLFRTLYLSAAQSDIKHYAALILFNIMFSKKDYNGIIDLQLDETEYINNDDADLVFAFNQFPDEKYNFKNNENVLNMELNISGSPLVEVGINGQKKKLWLDTGAQVSVISASTAVECGIQNNMHSPLTAIADSTNFKVSARPAYISNLELAGLSVENHPVIVLDDEMLQIQNPKTKEIIKVDGLIGWNVIQNIDISIDYKNKTIAINKPIERSISSTKMFVAGRLVLNLKTSDNTSVYFGIDTGASKSSISEKVATRILDKNIVKELITVGSVGGTKQVQARYIENQELFMGETKRLSFEKIRIESNFDDWAVFFKIDGVLGSDSIKNSCLHIDCLNGLVELID